MTVTIDPAATGSPPRSARRAALIDQIVAGTAVIAGHRRCAAARRLHQQGISMAHLQTLWILQESGPMPMTHLADLLGVAVPNATGIVERMEQRGLVERVHDDADRRVVTVHPTHLGELATEEVDGWRSDMLEALLDRLDTDQLARLVNGIDEMRETIRAGEPRESAASEVTDRPADPAVPRPTKEIVRR
ncbi:MAG: MarR family transcriptional regulator [Candidatus Limnocylindrales bacterium]|nr:MarR family transcriptional regulator [Candidatus Limnocylindrales bacterium]